MLSAGVPGKEQVRRYPLHCFYSVYLTPVQRGEVKRRKRRRRTGVMEALAVQNIRKAQKVPSGKGLGRNNRAALFMLQLKSSQFRRDHSHPTQISARII